jgi:hypothetical protein
MRTAEMATIGGLLIAAGVALGIVLNPDRPYLRLSKLWLADETEGELDAFSQLEDVTFG